MCVRVSVRVILIYSASVTQLLHRVVVGEISEAFNLPDDEFLTKYDAPKPLKGDSVVVYCRSGVRAVSGCDELGKLGFETYVQPDQ